MTTNHLLAHFNVIATANAGSGKTHLLISRAMALLLNNVDPSKIIIITYTRVAAKEIGDRILSTIQDFFNKTDDELRTTLVQFNAVDKIATARMLCNAYKDDNIIKVGTIHSFCQGLLDKQEDDINNLILQDEIKEQIKRELEQELFEISTNHQHPLHQPCKVFLNFLCITKANLLQKIVNEIVAKRLQLTNTNAIGGKKFLDLAFENHEEELLKIANRSSLKNIIALAEAKNNAKPLKVLEDFIKNAKMASENEIEEFSSLFLTQELTSKKQLLKQLPEAEPIATALEQFFKNKNSSIVVSGSIILRTMVDFVIARYNAPDYNTLIESAIFILKSQSGKFFDIVKTIDHLFVDEAQDVSPSSWEVIETLAYEMLNVQTDACPKSIFIVGDEKQSIFSFEGADVENFNNTIDRLKNRIRMMGLQLECPVLTESRRSKTKILEFVDNCFNKKHLLPAITRLPCVLHTSASNIDNAIEGVVKVIPFSKPPLQEREIGWQIKTEIPQEQKNPIIEETIKIIKNEISCGTKPEEIMVIVRERGTKNNAIHQLMLSLRQDGLQCQMDKIKIKSHPIFFEVVMFLKFVISKLLIGAPEDKASFYAVLAGCFGYMPLATIEETTSWETLKISHPNVFNVLNEAISICQNLGAGAAISFLLYSQNLINNVLNRHGQLGADVIEAMLEKILTSKNGFNLPTLIKELAMIDANVEAVNTIGGVIITTPHSAKGREAEVVLVCDISGKGKDEVTWSRRDLINIINNQMIFLPNLRPLTSEVDQFNLYANQKNMNEEMRCLYVALTRAKSKLFVIAQESSDPEKITYLSVCS